MLECVIPVSMARRIWTKKAIIDKLRELHLKNEDLTARHLGKAYPGLYDAGREEFGSHAGMCRAAGIDLISLYDTRKATDTKKRIGYKLDRDTTLRRLRALNDAGEDIRPTVLSLKHPGLYGAGIRHFKNCRSMYAAAGLDPSQFCTRMKWTNEEIKRRIMARHQDGKSLSRPLASKDCPAFVRAAERRYRGWYRALDAVGLPGESYRTGKPSGYWTRDRIASTIRLLDQKGIDTRPSALAKSHSGLIDAARREFPRLEDMYAFANVKPKNLRSRTRWTREMVISRFREIDPLAKGLTASQMCKRYSSLMKAGYRLIGGYDEMLKAAGMWKPKWSEEAIISALNDFAATGEDMSPRALRKDHRELYRCGVDLFGSCREMYFAAGFEKASLCKKMPWTEETLTHLIHKLQEQGEDIRPSALAVSHGGALTAAKRIFGSVWSYYEKAGIDAHEVGAKVAARWTKEEVIAKITELQSQGIAVSPSYLRDNHLTLYLAILKFFGNCALMYEAAGIPPDKYAARKRGYWNEDRVIERIKKWNSEKVRIDRISMVERDITLVAKAEILYGTWYKALARAGINPDEHRLAAERGYWSAERIISEIRELHEAGRDLCHGYMNVDHGDLANAAIRTFGSWRRAIEAAGFDYNRIRKDKRTESFMGTVFEGIVHQALLALGWKIVKKEFRNQNRAFRPDFFDLSTETWIDAKLHSCGSGVNATIMKYQTQCQRLMIIYLKGPQRRWHDSSVEFVPIRMFYPDLVKSESAHIVRKFEMLRKGILEPHLQSELRRFLSVDEMHDS